jgi:hypothetical protein
LLHFWWMTSCTYDMPRSASCKWTSFSFIPYEFMHFNRYVLHKFLRAWSAKLAIKFTYVNLGLSFFFLNRPLSTLSFRQGIHSDFQIWLSKKRLLKIGILYGNMKPGLAIYPYILWYHSLLHFHIT